MTHAIDSFAGYQDNPTLPQIRSADACAAIGCNAQWLKNMVSRTPAVVFLQPGERIDRGGRQYLALSLVSVIHLGLVHRLSGKDRPTPRRAHELASVFTYSGAASIGPNGQDREPGELFDRGFTYLFVDPAEVLAEVVAAEPGSDVIQFLRTGRDRNSGSPGSGSSRSPR